MAAGVPVVLPNDGSFPEIIEATQGGYLYDPKEDGGLIRALEQALCEPEKAKKMGLQGHHSVKNNFANEQLAVALVDQLLSPLQTSKS